MCVGGVPRAAVVRAGPAPRWPRGGGLALKGLGMEWGVSTHREEWVLGREGPEEARAGARERAVAAGAGPGPALEAAEEAVLARHYEGLIVQVGARLGLPEAVREVGTIFFKRFYLAHSAMDFDPGRMSLTALYLAGKVENHYIPAEDLGQCVGREAKAVLAGEIAMLEALRFHLAVHAPCRALGGLLHGFEARESSNGKFGEQGAGSGAAAEEKPSENRARFTEVSKYARGALQRLMATDAPLRFAPARLAVAALRSAGRSAGDPRVKVFLDAEIDRAAAAADVAAAPVEGGGGPSGGQVGSSAVQLLRGFEEELAEIDLLGAEPVSQTSMEELQRIDAKLRKCRNPLFDPAAKKKKKKEEAPGGLGPLASARAVEAGPSDAPEGPAAAVLKAGAAAGEEEGVEGRRGSLKRTGPDSPEEDGGGEGAKRRKSGPGDGDEMGG